MISFAGIFFFFDFCKCAFDSAIKCKHVGAHFNGMVLRSVGRCAVHVELFTCPNSRDF